MTNEKEVLKKIFDQFEKVGLEGYSLMLVKEHRDKIINKILSAGFRMREEINEEHCKYQKLYPRCKLDQTICDEDNCKKRSLKW